MINIPKEDWDTVLNGRNIYLQTSYLHAIENSQDTMGFRYVTYYDSKNKPIAIFYFQLVTIGPKQINPDAILKKIGNVLPEWLLQSLEIKILICGSAFSSGENGFLFNPDIDSATQLKILDEVIKEINNQEKENSRKVSITLLKDYWPKSFLTMKKLSKYKFHEGKIDSNMVLKIPAEWKDFDDYLAAMKTKFRTKAKNVQKRSCQLIEHDFTLESIDTHREQINKLYLSTVKNAEFSFAHLNVQTFLEIKKAIGDKFMFKGYFLENRLIGFSTATCFDNIIDGNFIGLDYEFNKSHCVYQRILYDFVRHAFLIGATEIRIGRTAEEIKSGIGAEPIEMKLYARHRNKFNNHILKAVASKLTASSSNLRFPFKAEYYK